MLWLLKELSCVRFYQVDIDASMLSIIGKAIMAKVSALCASEGSAIPYMPDPEGRLEDGKRWWEVRRCRMSTRW